MVRLDRRTLRQSEDAFVDDLLSSAHDLNIPALLAKFPRVYVDVNRDRREIDRTLVIDPEKLLLSDALNTSRVKAGLGVVARMVNSETPIYSNKITAQDVLMRLIALYDPYHAELKRMIGSAKANFGYCILIDFHSMPSLKNKIARYDRADVVIGDRHGTSCSAALTHAVESLFSDFGYKTARNTPYAGGYITGHYGLPHQGVHAIQVEISRDLYMDEYKLSRHSGFKILEDHVSIVLQAVQAIPRSDITAPDNWAISAE